MNDLQLYEYYKTIPLSEINAFSWIYPNYVKITRKSVVRPDPHRHYTFDEFIDRLYEEGSDFRKMLEIGEVKIYPVSKMTIEKKSISDMFEEFFKNR